MTLTPIAVSPKQAAELLGVSPDHIYRLLTSGEIKSGKSGARVLVEVESIKDYMETIRRESA